MITASNGAAYPIRLEFWQGGSLFADGAAMAQEHPGTLAGFLPFDLRRRMTENRDIVLATYLHLVSESEGKGIITPAAEWILDNHHAVDESARHLRRSLTVQFYRDLPFVKVGEGHSTPRTLAIAWRYISIVNSDFNAATLTEFVEGYQSVLPLDIRELWAIPTMVRFILLENLRRLAVRVETARLNRERANSLADIVSQMPLAEVPAVISNYAADRNNDTFAAQLLYRLRDGQERERAALPWLEQGLAARGTSPEQVIIAEQSTQSSGNVTVGNIIRALRAVDDVDWLDWFEGASRVDAILRSDSGYALLDRQTRNEYRNVVERVARHSDSSEIEVATRVIEASSEGDPGLVLLGPGFAALAKACGYRPPWRERALAAYRSLGWVGIAAPLLILTIAFSLLMARIDTGGVWILLFLVALLPASEAATAIVHFCSARLVPPSRLPGYDFTDAIPEDARTLLVIPCILTSRDEIDDLTRNLELHYLANPRGAVDFALLGDWADCAQETREDDQDLLAYARQSVEDLAAHYAHDGGRRFYLFHRRRLYNPSEGVWMGWERKRGKLLELNALLRGDDDTTYLDTGPLPAQSVRYVLTLDSDTRLTRGSVAALVGKMAHPVNRPVFDAEGRITSGYGLMQPRVTPSLTTGAEASVFQRIFSVNRGFDPYVFTVSDLYQDLLHEGSFTGKGLYDIDAFRRVVDDAISENTVLSHDLLEGSLARTALVTDVQFVEDFPIRYDVDAARQSRWIRGDWQLLGYIFSLKSPLNGLARFKMLDNLRRSLAPIAWIGASLAGWLSLGAHSAVLWQLGLIALLMAGPILAFFSGLPRRDTAQHQMIHLRVIAEEFVSFVMLALLKIASLADQAVTSADAILRALVRVYITRRHLLEWRTAGQVAAAGRTEMGDFLRRMPGAVIIAVAALVLVATLNPAGLFAAVPIAALWLLSPVIAWWISQSEETVDHLHLRPEDETVLRSTARLTWSFFETFVNASTHHLPPDNYQDDPAPKIAERTSPTNIGLYLLSVVSAREFGWIGLGDALARLDATLKTVERLPKYRGHLYNWYATNDLSILQPQYVSTVDSGNLAAHLVTLSSTLKDWAMGAQIHLPPDPRGIGDVLEVLRWQIESVPDDRRTLRPLRRRVIERVEGFAQSYASYTDEPQLAPVRGLTLMVVARDVEKLAGALHAALETPASAEVVRWSEALVAACQAIVDDTQDTPRQIQQSKLLSLAERARDLAFNMDFAFLMNAEKRLLSIGFRVDTGKLDQSCYDLLASEARLASFFAIAKGDLPNEHWFRLGRPATTVRARGVLLSWSGSMFEYLMPPLVMKEQIGGVLAQSNAGAVRCQIDAAQGGGAPWGVSESALNARDSHMNYQYYAFGVSGLALKRVDMDDHVIAPYATILASQIFPREAVENLARLDAIGARGQYGYFDAVDLTPTRLPQGDRRAVVRTVMAHHQGMSITAIANVVLKGLHRERFHADPVVQAAELLLQEKAPREIVPVTRPDRSSRPIGSDKDSQRPAQTVVTNPETAERAIALLSNGRYSRMLTSRGGGWSRLGNMAVLRWRGDPSLDLDGSFIYLRDLDTGRWSTATASPKTHPDQRATTIISDHKVEFTKTTGTLETHLECIVASEADAEGQRLTLRNNGTEARHIEVTSYAEVVLDAEAADRAHPAFSKMFVETAIAPEGDVITARRHQRDQGKTGPFLAHLICSDGVLRGVKAETDRRVFLGRGRSVANPAAMDHGARLTGSQGYTMDPIVSLRRRVRVPAGQEVVLTFWTITAPDEEQLAAGIRHYSNSSVWDHEARLAWTQSQIEIRRNGSSMDEIAVFRDAARHLIFADLRLAAPDASKGVWEGRQSELWPLGISGDAPIIVLRVDTEEDLPIVRKSLRMMEYFRSKGLPADLVLLNEQKGGYAANLQHQLNVLIDYAVHLAPAGAPRSLFALQRDMVDKGRVMNLLASARLVLHARNGTWSDQLARIVSSSAPRISRAAHPLLLPPPEPAPQAAPYLASFPEEPLEFFNGYGGFADDGRTYVIRLRHGQTTPHPWINVIARDNFGFHVAAEGAGYTWAVNSRDYQITPWSNDPVQNRAGEGVILKDRTSGRIATPFAAFSRDPQAIYETRHSPAKSAFRSWSDWITLEAVQDLAAAGPAKITRLKLTNCGSSPLDLDCMAWAELVQGNNRTASAPMIRVRHDAEANALLAENSWNAEYAGRVTALASDRPFTAHRADRRGLFDAVDGQLVVQDSGRWPVAGAATDTQGDPCLAVVHRLQLAPQESIELSYALADTTAEQMPDLIAQLFQTGQPQPADEWEEILGTLQVKTPDRKFDLMINTWLPYQCLSCRIRARSAFYQASGAYGFRDQLQDTSAMILHDPALARDQILAAAGRQFPEGDVQHWWLPATGAGVRTLISDDVIWLAHSVARYVSLTHDSAVLDEQIGYLDGPRLEDGQHDAFYQPEPSHLVESLYDHCARALDLAVARTSDRGLPLILGGDWNDGMNRVGIAGRGESVWLGWFLCATLESFAPLAQARGDTDKAAEWLAHRDRVAAAINALTWDGSWYQRGSFDDGTPLGTDGAPACEIDSIAQSWASLSGAAPPERADMALNSALERLHDRENRLMRLFTPPFTGGQPDPGYIAAYPPGVRENGGQYTHAATWMVYALARAGRGDDAFALFETLNPIAHALTQADADHYRVEPYVVAADVYGAHDKIGRGGWTWYTGAAGWLYRAAVEGILGICADGPNGVTVTPAIPEDWDGFTATLRRNGTVQRIEVSRQADGQLKVSIEPQTEGGTA